MKTAGRKPIETGPRSAGGDVDAHDLRDSQVVDQRDGGVDAGDDQEGDHGEAAGDDERLEDRELAHEADHRRDADEADEDRGEGDGNERCTADEAGVIGDFFGAERVAEEGDDGEAAEVHEDVGGEIEEEGGDGFAGADDVGAGELHGGGDGHDHVAGVGDCGVGEEAFDVGLAVGGEVAEGAGDGGEDGEEEDDEVADGGEGGGAVGEGRMDLIRRRLGGQ